MVNEAFRQFRVEIEKGFTEWQWYASCQGADPEEFYPDGVAQQRKIAAAVCSHCAVRLECLEYAIVMEESSVDHSVKAVMTRMGVWGGLADADRKKLARQLRETLPVWPPTDSFLDALEPLSEAYPAPRARHAS